MTVMADHGVTTVDEFVELMEEMLEKAHEIKQTSTVEPPLHKSDLAGFYGRMSTIFSSIPSDYSKRTIETAVRQIFYNLLASTFIESPSFVRMWNLFDIISILSDDGHTEPPLLFWLVEELIDSQIISGCRHVFDYLESRRERIIAKDFKSKNLVILRTCNELLRRLSRAEDTAFCGRVFIFLFQSFPLGDKSSVNLRGEYHTKNITTFEQLQPKEAPPVSMELDVDTAPDAKPAIDNARKDPEESTAGAKGVSFSKAEKPLDVDELYPTFWKLQQNFSQPKSLFDPKIFASFKSGLQATITKFKSVQAENPGRPSKTSEEVKKGTKRKRQGDDDLANAFHLKYLTSPDLFELEIGDLSFRRHILVQVLIIIDFLLLQSPRAKAKVAKANIQNPNKAVTYEWTLSEEDTKWALDTKASVAKYLGQGYEGPFYLRMIETVLSRDKNWVRWKVENCPSIARPALEPDACAESKRKIEAECSKRRRLNPNLHADRALGFLKAGNNLDRLKRSERYEVKALKEYEELINVDGEKIESDIYDEGESKETVMEARASKTWRALRTAAASKLVTFDKIDRSDKIDEVFKENLKPEESTTTAEDDSEDMEIETPTARRPIIISGPSGVGKGTLVTMLMEKHPKVFGKKASHTTRKPRDGEVDGIHYYFVEKKDYDILLDGDKFLEFNNFNGNDYGTSKKVVEDIKAQGKVPLMEMDYHGIQQLKDQSYECRFIFLNPPDIPTLEKRLRERGTDDEEKIKQRLEIALEEIKQSKVEGFHDKIIINDNLETAYKELEDYIFGREENSGADGVVVEKDKVEVEVIENGHLTPAVAEIGTEAVAVAEKTE